MAVTTVTVSGGREVEWRVMTMTARRTVLFVCPHGAGKSRIAAAWFDGLGLAGWTATSAGLQPRPQFSAASMPAVRP
jgi:hypothetical protein